MTEEFAPNNDRDLTGVVTGILADAEKLFQQELLLMRGEVREEIGRAGAAAISLGAGIVLLYMSVLLLTFTIVFLLFDTIGSGTQGIPLWGCFGIVAAAVGLIGAAAAKLGRSKLGKVHVVPPETFQSLQETSAAVKEGFSA